MAKGGRSNEGGSVEGEGVLEMLTFSREQRCIEAAVAVASHPPSPLCISPSLLSSFPLPFLFSSVQTDRDEKLAADQNTPPTITACYLPHMLSPPFPSLLLSFLSLFLSLPSFSPPPLPLFCFAATLLFQLSPPPVSHSVHLSSPASSLFRFQSSSLHLSSSHSPSFFVIFSTPLFTSTPTSKQQK